MADFRILLTKELHQQFQEWCDRAVAGRRGLFALEQAEFLMAKLRTAPHTIGEALCHSPNGLPVYHAVAAPWSFHYVVNDPLHLVYLTKIALLS